MKNYTVIAILAIAFISPLASAQSLTTVPTTDPVQTPAIIAAGQVSVFNTGTWQVAAGQTVNKVVVIWYSMSQNSSVLTEVATVDDLAPAANNTYSTTKVALQKKDANNNVIRYAGFAFLYVNGPGANGANNPVKVGSPASFFGFTP